MDPNYRHNVTPIPEGDYRLSANLFNDLYDHAVRNFNEQSTKWEEGSYPYTYAQAFWNGYAAAIAGLRDTARLFPVTPEVQ